MPTRWLLVSDASRARLFREDPRHERYDLIESFEHPESRARVRDLMADATGRKPVGPSVGASHASRSISLGHGRVGVEPDTDAKEVEAERFARELAGVLEKWLQQHAFDKLVLAAPPHFLGLLRAAVSREITKRIEASLHKDLTMIDARELHARVRSELAV